MLKRTWRASLLLIVALAVAGAAATVWSAKAAPAPAVPLEDLLKKARCDGKYTMLLAQIKVEKDMETYKEFTDLGIQTRTEYKGHKDLPKGHWVYVYPYWYIFRDLTVVHEKRPKRAWGYEQVIGEPDTNEAGDIQTAWASAGQDDRDEWLICEYAEPIVPSAVLVHETYNPGALYRVTVFKLDGEEVEVWKGTDPTPTDSGKGVSEVPVKVDYKVSRVKIYLDSKAVPGWNEIDAVGVRDKNKAMHWATNVEASSNYAGEYPAPNLIEVTREDRLRKLEKEVQDLKKLVEDLQKQIKKDNK